MDEIHQKLSYLEQYLKGLESVVTAFSGGVDSAFLAVAAHRVLGERALAVTACSGAFPKRELEEAEELAKREGMRHAKTEFPIFQVEGFAQNPPDRCYHCKTAILKEMRRIARREGLRYVIEGSNVDDADDYRPGARAIQEQKVLSPLKEAGLGKQEIRELSREWGLPTWKKQSAACLASRFAYGEMITEEKLSMVEQAEEYLKSLGFGQLRVRVHGETARIELSEGELEKAAEKENREKIFEKLRELGFAYVTLDLKGYRMGSMNKVISTERR